MSVFKVLSSSANILETIHSWLKLGETPKIKWKQIHSYPSKKELERESYVTEVSGKVKIFHINLILRTTEQNENFSIIQMECHAGKKSILFMVILYLPVYAIGFFLGYTARSIQNSGINPLAIYSTISLLPFITCSASLILFYRGIAKQLKSLQFSFYNFLSGKNSVKVISPISADTLTVNVRIVFFISQIIYWTWMLLLLDLLFLILGFMILIILSVPIILKILATRNPRIKWKTELAFIAGFWSLLCLSFLFAILFPIGFCFGQITTTSLNPIPNLTINKLFTFLHSVESSPDIISALLNMNISVLSYININEYITRTGMFFFIMIVPLLLFACVSILLVRSSKRWQETLGIMSKPISIIPPACTFNESDEGKKFFKYFVILHYSAASIFNIFACIYAFDGLVYLITGESPLLRNFWTWFLEFYKLLVPPPYASIFSKIHIIILCFPFVVAIALNMKRFLTFIITLIENCISGRHYNEKRSRRITEIENIVDHISKKAGLIRPKIKLIRRKKLGIPYIKWNLLIKKPVLLIPLVVLEKFQKDELKAIIAHELGHKKNELVKIEVLRILSAITFFSNYYLTLALDLSNSEFLADKFAIEQTGNRKALIKALFSFSNLQMLTFSFTPDNRWRRINKVIQTLRFSFEFLFGEGLLGYNHPPVSKRLAYIKQLDIDNE